jgi:hypothetical protein
MSRLAIAALLLAACARKPPPLPEAELVAPLAAFLETLAAAMEDPALERLPLDEAAHHLAARLLCQLPPGVASATACPRPVPMSEVLGGRYPEGREVCVETTLLFAVFNPGDRDTHV